jgi:ABC-type Mn2+/Zn2+ transport system ATPase subunit
VSRLRPVERPVPAAPAAAPPGAPLVRCAGLAVGYDGRAALEGVGLTVGAGERVAVLGPNGGGKTTLFRALLGELRPLAGELELGSRAAVVPQTDRSRLDFPVSALDVVLMGTLPLRPWWRRPSRADRARAREALQRVGLADRAGATFGALSGGQRQRVLIARALVQDARLLLLDEPFTGLDAPSEARLHALVDDLAAQGCALLIATHELAEARAWDRVLCLNRRQIAFGPPAQVLTPDVLAATYGDALVALPGGAAVVVEHCHE